MTDIEAGEALHFSSPAQYEFTPRPLYPAVYG